MADETTKVRYTTDEASKQLFELLKEPLKLHEKCIEFTLTVGVDKIPVVEQTYFVDDYFRNEKHGKKN